MLITGASTGIGRAAAVHLATEGWRVFAGVRKPVDFESVAAAHERIRPIRLDVSDAASVAAAAREVAAMLGGAGLDGLVNNAGVALIAPLELMPEEEFARVFDVNVTGPLRVTQQFLPLLRTAKGRIVNMGSQSGTLAYPGFGAYSCSKFALEAFSDTLRMEMAQFGIQVAHINPGVVKTPIWERGAANSEAVMQRADGEAVRLYAELQRQVLAGAAAAEAKGVSVQETNETILHALTAASPHTRYIVGAKAALLMRLRRWVLPDRVFDSLVLDTLAKL